MNSLVHIPRNGQLQKKVNSTPKGWSNWVDDLLTIDHLPSAFASNFNTSTLPKVNIKETKDVFILDVVAPGLEKSDFKIDIDKKALTITSEVKEDATEDDTAFTRREFSFSAFKRTFSLPDTVDDTKIEAKYTAGILKVVLPKREEAKEKPPRTIEIS